ncbi:hypothetical protein L1280_001617 [Deinococcus sp. HSC-46F16]|uniref:hypothetical protein n=1 Tax=Deinococcus sp. HSC-46F16 TaxID=2910968 RepID=UPI0020A179EA|nr:hypothetical protein [Deinococcus sp. HSC-46F16]MCP2014466.1 hypothetical protein [Deinococcus sp. HSC-46F16]
MRVLCSVLTALLALTPLCAPARAEAAPPPPPVATGMADSPPTLPQGDDPKGGGGLG